MDNEQLDQRCLSLTSTDWGFAVVCLTVETKVPRENLPSLPGYHITSHLSKLGIQLGPHLWVARVLTIEPAWDSWPTRQSWWLADLNWIIISLKSFEVKEKDTAKIAVLFSSFGKAPTLHCYALGLKLCTACIYAQQNTFWKWTKVAIF